MKPLARLAVAVGRVLYFLLLRWTVRGGEHVPVSGPCILIANHVHLADPVLLMLAFPRPITFMAKEELFRVPIWGQIMRDGGMFPVARAGTLQQKRDVMRLAENLLTQGRVLALFPEGRRSPQVSSSRASPVPPSSPSAPVRPWCPLPSREPSRYEGQVVVAETAACHRHHRCSLPSHIRGKPGGPLGISPPHRRVDETRRAAAAS